MIAFGPYRLDLARQELRRGDEPVPLTPKAFDTLRMLVEADGAVVAKEEILAAVWRDRFVEESVLSQNVYTLRKVLAEGDDGRAYIVTVPRRGYRLAVPVERPAAPSATSAVEAGAGATPAPSLAPRSPNRVRLWVWSAVAALLVVAVATSVWLRTQSAPAPPSNALRVDSVAVLPFLELGPHPGDDLLGLAMADALITRLSELQPLVVRPTSAVQELRQAPRDPLVIGRRLHVDAVMDGSLQRSGDRLRLNVRLLRVEDGRPLWARSFETVATDPFVVQDAISEQVAGALSLELSEKPHRPANRGTWSIEAYQEYVRGRYLWNRRTEADLRQALVQFQSAIARDPRFAAAHAGIADSWALLPLYGSVPPTLAFPRALSSANVALTLDPELAEGHTSMAYSRFLYEWDWDRAEEEFRKAQRLDPTYATAAQWYATMLSALGRHEEAIATARLAQRLDPLSLPVNADLGLTLYFARRYDEAIAQFRRTLELDARFPYAHFGLALVEVAAGKRAEAVTEAQQAMELSGGSGVMQGLLGYALASAGRVDEARALQAALVERARHQRVQPGAFALVALGLAAQSPADRDEALRQLDAACRERSRFVVFLDVWPIYDAVRADPRFAALVKRVGLPSRP